MPWSGIAGSIVGSLGSLAGGLIDSHNDRKLAQMGYDFQREVYQNQYQWKAADAKKAGLHPLAVIGGGSYSGSPVSVGGTNFAGALGKLGEGIGDAFAAYKDKDDMAAEQAIKELRDAEAFKSSQNESEARTDMYRANAEESRARAQSYTTPMATGKEKIPGQVDSYAPEGFTIPKKNKTGLVSNKNSAIHVWYMGNGQYDINFNPDYQGTMGDEIGQFVNALKAGTRPPRYYDVDLDRVFYYNADTGYYQDVPVDNPPYSVFAPRKRSGGGGI